MAYNADTARWYLAELVTEVRIVGERENVVHNNLILIRAQSAEEAYQKAEARGQEMDEMYESEGQRIKVTFRGLSDLNLIQDELEDGAEIAYEEMSDMSEAEIQEMLTEKDQLGVFVSDDDHENHDHTHDSQSALEEAMRIINKNKREQ